MMTVGASCDGEGHCPEPVTRECTPYVCGADRCLTSCGGDEDCAEGHCEEERCVRDAVCLDDLTLSQPDGVLVGCSPYRCREGRCATSCSSVLDCASGLVCNAQGVCQPPMGGGATAEEGGCALAAPRRARSGTSGRLVAALLTLAAVSRSRRREMARRRATA
jgi:hypothetical protein